MSDVAIHASGITRSYRERKALDGFSLEVPAGGAFGLLGPNGSGKSTFIAMLAAMQTPESGEVRVFGEPPSRRLLAHTGAVFQENTADPLMRTGDYLRFAGRLYGLAGPALAARSRELLKVFGLEARISDPVAQLSGGMRRRLEVARALLHRPQLLLLDEPTTGIDAEERALLWAALRQSSTDVTILLATNDLSEADTVCDRVAFVQLGRVVASGSPAELKAGLRAESVRIEWPAVDDSHLAAIATWPGTGAVAREGDTVRITTDDASTFVPRLFELAPGEIRSVAIAGASLEDAYFQHIRRRAAAVTE